MPRQSTNYHVEHRIRALLFDLGDTLMWESSEVKDEDGTTIRADLIPGAADLIWSLREDGYWLGMVADSKPRTPINVLEQHHLLDCFDTVMISDLVGTAKPNAGIFRSALAALEIEERDYSRVYMIGNNLERDIVGANGVGLRSILMVPNDCRRSTPADRLETPDHTVRSIEELRDLIDRLDVREANKSTAASDNPE